MKNDQISTFEDIKNESSCDKVKTDPLSWGKTVYLLRKAHDAFLGVIWEPKWEVRTACLPADHVRSQLNRNDVTFADPFAVAVQLQFVSISLQGSDRRVFKWILFSSFYLFWVSWVYAVWKVSEYWCFIQIVCCRYKAYLALETISASIEDTFCKVSNFKNETIY